MRGTLRFIDDDLPRAFGDLTTCTCSAISPTPRPRRPHAIGALHRRTSRRDLAPRSKGSFRLGRDDVRAEAAPRRRHRRSTPIACSRSPRASCTTTQEEFRRVASRLERRRSARGLGARPKDDHPAAGQLVAGRAAAARRARRRSSSGSASSRCRTAAPVAGRADAASSTAGRSPACGRRARSRAKPLRAYYYITDVDPSWPAERQDEHLRDFNYGALWSISIHEVFPGHFLHYQHLRQVDVEAAQVDPVLVDRVRRRLGALLRADDDRGRLPASSDHAVRLGQLAEALIRLCRLHRRHPAALRGPVGRAGRALLPRRGVSRGGERAARSRARHVRSVVRPLHRRQADAAEAARGLQGAAGGKVLAARVPRHAARQRHGAALAAPRS